MEGQETLKERMNREADRGKQFMEEAKRKEMAERARGVRNNQIKCTSCGALVVVTEQQADDIRREYRIERMLQNSRELRAKRGPYYDRWLSSMRRAIESLEAVQE